MSEESFAQMLDNEEWKEIRTGEVVDGTVIAVKPDKIVLNIGGKSDGIITRSEYTSAPDVDLTTVVSVGDEMKAKVLKSMMVRDRLLLHIESLLQIMAIRSLKMHLTVRNQSQALLRTLRAVLKLSLTKQEYLFLQALFQIHLLRIYLYITVRKLHLSSLNMILRTERLSVTASSLLLQLRRQQQRQFFLRLRKAIQSKEQLRMLQISVHSLT